MLIITGITSIDFSQFAIVTSVEELARGSMTFIDHQFQVMIRQIAKVLLK